MRVENDEKLIVCLLFFISLYYSNLCELRTSLLIYHNTLHPRIRTVCGQTERGATSDCDATVIATYDDTSRLRPESVSDVLDIL